MRNQNKKAGFTLAEILITLGVIGVVAAITIPSLISNNQKKAYVTGLQKFNSQFQQGMKNYMQKVGCSDLTCTNLFEGQNYMGGDADAWATNATSQLANVFSGAQFYGNQNGQVNTFRTTLLGGASSDENFRFGFAFRLADGTLINIQDDDSGNCTRWSAATAGARLRNACAEILVDVNGIKKPNIAGRDYFIFELGNDGLLYPCNGHDHDVAAASAYWQNDPDRCGTSGSSTIASSARGSGCSARIMEEGWEMNY